MLGKCRGDAAVDMGKLSIAIRVPVALTSLSIALQAEFLLLEQFVHDGVADLVNTRTKFGGQPA